MAWAIDARIPVRLGALADAADDDAVLVEGSLPACAHPAERFDPAPPGHAPGCACCVPRSGAARALDRLFQRRARGEGPFFRRVLAVTATPEGDVEVSSALRDDNLASARFRLDDR
jgi:hypothetical protein